MAARPARTKPRTSSVKFKLVSRITGIAHNRLALYKGAGRTATVAAENLLSAVEEPGYNEPQEIQTMRIIVIGSGFGGLGAAIRLQRRGHDVLLLEKRDKPGGRAYVYEQDGFKFDGGPTVITAPWLINELFEGAGRRAEDYVQMVPVDPFTASFLTMAAIITIRAIRTQWSGRSR